MNYSLHIKSAAFALEKTSIRGRFFCKYRRYRSYFL